jgi:hypothetical protein
MIKRVKALETGQAYVFDEVLCQIDSFPSRSTVVVKNIAQREGQWSIAKVPVREFNKTAVRCEAVQQIPYLAGVLISKFCQARWDQIGKEKK